MVKIVNPVQHILCPDTASFPKQCPIIGPPLPHATTGPHPLPRPLHILQRTHLTFGKRARAACTGSSDESTPTTAAQRAASSAVVKPARHIGM